ncbi:REP-associated tyrosine transposase [Halomonas organivorans]|uniref:REP element-mobilizing transposase RayT n=1 Tax=Halomonas organivorans TaxID=257772 RepID=A0A7W5BX99_9GAMM|nr:transposase [Halomonas organivorans]MBB3140767.1 REP element-mobilizing transposase RayT [Halomonas organivorans]
MPASHSCRLRKGRSSSPGYCYLITMVTASRRPVFHDHRHAASASRQFYAPAVVQHGDTLCYVVMPDHVHWLVQLKGDLSLLVRIYKSRVSIAVGRPIWQPGFHDHALRHEEELKAMARYVVANPLRAGLVSHITDYPYWNAVWL